MSNKPFISIVIPAHNEARYIEKTLRVLQAQTYASYEVVVVANGCTDATASKARAIGNTLVRVLVTKKAGISIALNAGARVARGPLLVFLDADTVLEPCALDVIARTFLKRHAVGTLRASPDLPRQHYRFLYAYKNAAHQLRFYTGSSGIIVTWKRVFQAIKGFDETLHCRENKDFIRRALRHGSYAFIAKTTATTSMRRYERQGFLPQAWFWTKIWIRSQVGKHRGLRYETIR